MYPTQKYTVQSFKDTPDSIGGFHKTWQTFLIVNGYLDLISGTDLNNKQNAFVEDSTHLLVLPEFVPGITKAMRVVDSENRFYDITYSDDPMNLHHHNEIYLMYGGELDGSEI
jgi:hypothetical protein